MSGSSSPAGRAKSLLKDFLDRKNSGVPTSPNGETSSQGILTGNQSTQTSPRSEGMSISSPSPKNISTENMSSPLSNASTGGRQSHLLRLYQSFYYADDGNVHGWLMKMKSNGGKIARFCSLNHNVRLFYYARTEQCHRISFPVRFEDIIEVRFVYEELPDSGSTMSDPEAFAFRFAFVVLSKRKKSTFFAKTKVDAENWVKALNACKLQSSSDSCMPLSPDEYGPSSENHDAIVEASSLLEHRLNVMKQQKEEISAKDLEIEGLRQELLRVQQDRPKQVTAGSMPLETGCWAMLVSTICSGSFVRREQRQLTHVSPATECSETSAKGNQDGPPLSSELPKIPQDTKQIVQSSSHGKRRDSSFEELLGIFQARTGDKGVADNPIIESIFQARAGQPEQGRGEVAPDDKDWV